MGAVQSVHPQKLFGHILVLDSLPLPPMVGVRTADARANEPAKRICLLVHDHRFLKCEPRGMIPRGVDPVVEKHFQRERERERKDTWTGHVFFAAGLAENYSGHEENIRERLETPFL